MSIDASRSYSTDGLTDSSAPELNTTGGIDKLWNHVGNKKSQSTASSIKTHIFYRKVLQRYNCIQCAPPESHLLWREVAQFKGQGFQENWFYFIQ